jgi:hypothetical protein
MTRAHAHMNAARGHLDGLGLDEERRIEETDVPPDEMQQQANKHLSQMRYLGRTNTYKPLYSGYMRLPVVRRSAYTVRRIKTLPYVVSDYTETRDPMV